MVLLFICHMQVLTNMIEYANIVTMENMKIYTNGQYDYKANLIFKARLKLPVIIDRIDNFFTNH